MDETFGHRNHGGLLFRKSSSGKNGVDAPQPPARLHSKSATNPESKEQPGNHCKVLA